MRKLIIWVLVVLMALPGFAFAEQADAAETAVNGAGAALAGADLYLAIPDGARQMLVCVPTGGGDPVCVDRGDRFEDLIPYGSGVVYLKTENGSSAIMSCDGATVKSVYGFGASEASCLSYYGGKLLVLIDGLLHSIDPGTQLCLRLSGSTMLDYVLGDGKAYFLSAGDRMEYTATLKSGEKVSVQAGCVYSLDLNSGETTLLLKSGGEDLQISGGMLYFHNLSDAYAVRTATGAELLGRVHGLDVQQHSLTDGCAEPDNGFWALESGLVVWYNGALNTETEAGTLALYAPEGGATVVTDGRELFVWESGKQTLSQVLLNGTQTVVYSGNLAAAKDLSLTVSATPNPSASASASLAPEATGGDVDPEGGSGWFSSYMDSQSGSGSSGSSSGSASVWTQATPIGATPTPVPTPAPVTNAGTSDGSGSSGSSGSSGGSSGSSGTRQSGDTYSVSIKYLKITGGSVNVRSGPGTSYSIKTSLHEGTVVESTGRAAKDSGGNTWYQISSNGSKGWVSAGYAKKSSGPDLSYSGPEWSKSGSTVTITGDSVNVRAKPNLNGADLGVVKKGAKLSFKGKGSTDARGVDWYKVSYNGKTGWVSSRYSKVTGSGSSSSGSSGGSSSGATSASGTRYTTGKVNVRSGPGLDYGSKGTIASGTKFVISQKARDGRGVTWFKGEGGGKSGWVSSVYLSESKPGSGSSGGSSSGKVVTTGDVTIRSKANKSSSKVGVIKKGKTVTYLGKSSKDGRGVWWYKISYNGKTGWISSKYSYIK